MEGGSIAVVMEDIQTRTAVTDEGAFTWSAGDQIWLEITANPGYVTGTLSSGAGAGRANFAYGTYFGDMTGKAVYPFNVGHDVNGNELSVVLPASYDLGSNLSNTNAAMYGVETNGSIKFNHLAGVMRFKFINAPVGTDQFVITLDKKINGTFTTDLTEDYPVLQTETTSNESEKSITLNFDALTSVQDIMLYVPLPLGTYTTLGLEVKAGSQSVWTYSNTVTNTIKRKSLILMPSVTLAGSVSGDIEGSENIVNLSESGTANSYIISEAGSYKFTPTKGNSNTSVGAISSVEVLWETFGTSETPAVGSLVSNVRYEGGSIIFSTPESFREGNAVIAAKDAVGTILWSWHIWLTDEPQEQVYYNNAGTMMDRNLGATSATPGDVGALGLLYQWGRKDPFLGSSSINSNVQAKSTMTWPPFVWSNSSNGTIAYASEHPMTFIERNTNNYDWYYTSSLSIDNTRWQSEKTIYDPCPSGWRIPDGGDNGVWSKALGSSSSFWDDLLYDSTNEGVNFSGKFGDASTIWYPASGCRDYNDYSHGGLGFVGNIGLCWSVSPNGNASYDLGIGNDGYFLPSRSDIRGYGNSVRCVKEGTPPSNPDPEPALEAVNLSQSGTANSYIVSSAGSYKFSAVKGNSSESVGAVASVASAEVLWETFGTSETPSVGSLISDVKYEGGSIIFSTPESFREGNAVIAAKDATGTILWSWHIWLTDQPEEQVYYNNAGTMMDRNLGATSATPGDVGALGLLYQWGRKDPFLGSSSISSSTEAKSTLTWPSAVSSDSSNGTIDYAIEHPTTFIKRNQNNNDWYDTGSSIDNTRWTTSETFKSVYDPCPVGWRVPDGGSNRLWSKAFGSSSIFPDASLYDSTNKGINFSGIFCDVATIWYPVSGYRNSYDGTLSAVGSNGYCWSASPTPQNFSTYGASLLVFGTGSNVTLDAGSDRSNGFSVRCVKENSSSDLPTEPETPAEPDLSQPSYSVQLNPATYGWVKSTSVSNPDASLYDGVYESTNQGMSNTKSIMYIDINGYDEFTIYVRSYADSYFDYVEVSNLDVNITYRTSGFKMTTSGNQQSGTSISSYTEVKFTNIGGGQHRIMVAYKKDYSYNENDDKGYVLIPKNKGSQTPSELQAIDYIDEYGINHGQGVEIDGVVWAPVNCGYHATDYKYGKLYQWGRKYGQGYGSSDASVTSIISGPVLFSVGQSESNTNKFYTSSNDWITPQDDALWNSGTEDDPVKTEYDPCPEGWRVPTYAELNALKANKSSWTTEDGQNGYWFSGSASYSASVSRVFFPAAGNRNLYGGVGDRGSYGFYWSSRPYSNYAFYLCFYSSDINMYDYYRAFGYSVRCVQVTD